MAIVFDSRGNNFNQIHIKYNDIFIEKPMLTEKPSKLTNGIRTHIGM